MFPYEWFPKMGNLVLPVLVIHTLFCEQNNAGMVSDIIGMGYYIGRNVARNWESWLRQYDYVVGKKH